MDQIPNIIPNRRSLIGSQLPNRDTNCLQLGTSTRFQIRGKRLPAGGPLIARWLPETTFRPNSHCSGGSPPPNHVNKYVFEHLSMSPVHFRNKKSKTNSKQFSKNNFQISSTKNDKNYQKGFKTYQKYTKNKQKIN